MGAGLSSAFAGSAGGGGTFPAIGAGSASGGGASGSSLKSATGSKKLATAALAANQIFAARAQGSAIREKGRFESAQAIVNARLAELQAEDAIRRGDIAVDDFRKSASQVIGTQRAALAAEGRDLGSGTASEIIRQSEEVSREDAERIRTNAFREAFGFRAQAIDLRSQARFTRISSKFAQRQTFLTGLTQAAQTLQSSK